MLIRDALESDLPAIVDIYNSTIPGRMVTADTEPVTSESRMEWFRAHKKGVRPLWVVEENGQMAGWLSFQSFYGRPAYRATVEVSVYVSDGVRRTGIGSTLLRRAIEYAPEMGVKTLMGFIFAHNEPSLRLFKKFGFTQWGYYPKIADLDGVERDLIIMGLRIKE